jgi:hypothetical protein
MLSIKIKKKKKAIRKEALKGPLNKEAPNNNAVCPVSFVSPLGTA